jgi:hypothetical protein
MLLGWRLVVGDVVGDEGEWVGNKFNVGVGAVLLVGAYVVPGSTALSTNITGDIMGLFCATKKNPSSIATRVSFTCVAEC